jgi:hypothetical protein
MQLHSTTCLKVYSYSIQRMYDPNWTGMDLYEELKQWYRGRREPKTLFHKITKEGVLFQIGKILFTEYLNRIESFENKRGEYLMWYMEDVVEFHVYHWPRRGRLLANEARRKLNEIDELFSNDENSYFDYVESDAFFEWCKRLHEQLNLHNAWGFRNICQNYAFDFANRAFNDLTFCSYISNMIRFIGIDGRSGDEDYFKWVKRTNIPSWAERAVVTRDNGLCVVCKKDLLREFTAPRHIDHIVPLSRAGINDLVNLQLMCDSCNRKKHANETDIYSSIPDYAQVGLSRR